MDIRKLQRAIVDGLEDVKASDVVVFNTEHLSPLFERVIVASGNSNRQTKALASSVREAVKSAGGEILSVEGEDNGEWIIVDCGAAVAHIMQPAIRQYYHLEEIWGGKAVRMKIGTATKGLVKASSEDDDEDLPSAPKARKTAKSASPAAGKPRTSSRGASASEAMAEGRKRAEAGAAGRKAAASKSAAPSSAKPAAKKPAPKPAAKSAFKTPARKAAAPRKTAGAAPAPRAAAPARKTSPARKTRPA